MKDILQELYHGMIHPEETYQPTDEIKALRRKLDAGQQELLKKIGQLDQNWETEVYTLLEEENAADAIEMEDAYIRGMRMGARLALALLGEQKKDRPSLA